MNNWFIAAVVVQEVRGEVEGGGAVVFVSRNYVLVSHAPRA